MSSGTMDDGTPYLAVGNSEPLPEGLPKQIEDILREHRTKAGWCDHGNRFGKCGAGCIKR